MAREIALIAANWHADLVDEAVAACRDALAADGAGGVREFRVPGSFEIVSI